MAQAFSSPSNRASRARELIIKGLMHEQLEQERARNTNSDNAAIQISSRHPIFADAIHGSFPDQAVIV